MANFSSYDFHLQFDLDNGNIVITDDSVITGNANLIQGENYKIVQPDNETLYENTSWVTPSIPPPLSASLTVALPTFANAIMWGNYTVTGTIKDEDGTTTTLVKTFNLCQPKSCNCAANSTSSCAEVQVKFDCPQSTLFVWNTTAYIYKGVEGVPTYSMTVTPPVNSGLSPVTVAAPTYTKTSIYNGIWNIAINDTVTFDMGNNIEVVILFETDINKTASCNYSLCEVECAFEEYLADYDAVKGTGSQRERTLAANLLQISLLLWKAQLGMQCGEDITDTIAEIEKITGKSCSCDCGTAVPATGVNSVYNVLVQADGGDIVVTQTTSGSNYIFKVKDKTYVIAPEPSMAGITITSELVGQTKTYYLAICPDELKLCDSFIVPDTSGSPSWTPAPVTVTVGDTVGDYFDAVDDALQNIQDFIQTALPYIANPTWINIADGDMQNSWVNLVQTSYTKDNWGWVEVRGTITVSPASATSTWFVFPAGYRPAITQTLSATLFDTVAGYLPAVISVSSVNGESKVTYAGTGSGTSRIGVNLRFSTIA